MKKKILILFLILITCGIIYSIHSNKRIEGIWINHYDTNVSGDYSFPGRDILNIKNQGFHSINHEVNGGIMKQRYFLIGQSLRLWPRDSMDFSFPIVSINQDSLMFDFLGGRKRIYKKVPDTLENSKDFNFDFTNKAFRMESEEGIDTAYFDSKLIYHRLKSHENMDWHTMGWQSMSIENYDFILFASATPVIVNEHEENILLYIQNDNNELLGIKLFEIQLDSSDIKSIARHKRYYVDP